MKGRRARRTGLPSYLDDGCRILEAALSHGLEVEMFPRQVAVYSTPESRGSARDGSPGQQSLAFVHGVPQSSTLAGVTYAQDKRISRGLFQRAKLPPVPGATFSFRGVEDAVVFASRVGYPVRVRLAQSDGISMPTVVAHDPDELEGVISELRVLPEHMAAAATNVRRSAYSLTPLLEFEEDVQRRKLWAISTRVLIQKDLPGSKLRLLVIDGEVHAVVQFGMGRKQHATVPNKLHPHVPRYAVKAVAAIPGLRVASVDLVVEDPGAKPVRGSYHVADVVERPRLHDFEVAKQGRARQLAILLLQAEARREGIELGPPAAEASIDVDFGGLVQSQKFMDRVLRHASVQHLRSNVIGTSATDGVASVRLEGSTRRLAVLLEVAMAEGLDGQRAMTFTAAPSP